MPHPLQLFKVIYSTENEPLDLTGKLLGLVVTPYVLPPPPPRVAGAAAAAAAAAAGAAGAAAAGVASCKFISWRSIRPRAYLGGRMGL